MGPHAGESADVLLLNLGGPDSLAAVRPFLYNLFSDREIIRLGPPFLQKPIAFLIAALRSGKTREAYSLIGGRSPINDITAAQAEALQRLLGENLRGSSPRVFVGMRYWQPFLGDVVAEMHRRGSRRFVALSLYPHYSMATTGSTLSCLRRVLEAYPDMQVQAIEHWYDHPRYVASLIERIRSKEETFRQALSAGGPSQDRDIHLLFSAHSLPVKFITEGDPYVDHIRATIDAVMKKIDLPWSLSYQSKSGPVAWLEPSTEQMLEDLARRGVRNLLVVPISFVSDHIETLYEIDLLYRNMAEGLGIRLERIESLNTSPEFISALAELVQKRVREAGWQE